MRAFIAIDLPDNIKDELEKVSSSVAMSGHIQVKKEHMHITLQFLGEITEESAEKIKTAIDSVKSGPIKITISGVSYFSPEKPRVVYASLTEGNEELKALYNKLDIALEKSGIKLRREPNYTPHVTLFRIKKTPASAQLTSLVSKYAKHRFGGFTAESIELKRSILSRSGPEYTTLHESKI